MALENETVGTKYGAERLQNYLRETLYEQNFMHLKDDLPGKDNPIVFSRTQGVTAAIASAVKSLPAWALESIDQILDGKAPDNLTYDKGALDPELRDRDAVAYLDALAAGIREGKIKPTDAARAEEHYLSKSPELEAKILADTANKKFGIEPEAGKNRAEIEKHKEELSKEAAKERLKREIKTEKAFQKLDKKENKTLIQAQKARGKFMDRNAKLRKAVLERNAEGQLVRKAGVTDRKFEQYRKNAELLKDASEKYGNLKKAAAERVANLYRDGLVTKHYNDYRLSQIETGNLDYKIAQNFARQEWSKAMLERAEIDKLPKSEQKQRIEAFRKQVAQEEAKAEKGKAPEKRKVEPAEIGMDKKAPEKTTADVKKETPIRQLGKTK